MEPELRCLSGYTTLTEVDMESSIVWDIKQQSSLEFGRFLARNPVLHFQDSGMSRGRNHRETENELCLVPNVARLTLLHPG
jgi:hypothetical protein